MRFLLSRGNRSDIGMAQELLSPLDLSGKLVLADKGYDSDKLSDWIKGRGGITVIPSRRSARHPRKIDWDIYKERHLIENLFLKLKNHRRFSTRYEKKALPGMKRRLPIFMPLFLLPVFWFGYFDGFKTGSRVINLSVGDPVRQLSTIMSPIARLIDYLAYKYKILFIISAGNHEEILSYINQSFADFKALNISGRNNVFGQVIKENQRNLKVLAPAESLNGLTIGALYDDFTNPEESDRLIWAVEKGMPSPISAYGKGYRSIITPDLFYYGGRKFVRRTLDGALDWALSNREPGCKVAAPYENDSGQAYSFGTSDAAAQITHEAAKCYDVLEEVFLNETGAHISNDYKAILLKAMLTHGASWDSIGDKVAVATGDSVKQLCKWLGNGIPNIGKVAECTKERVTLIGLGALKKEKGDIFKLPLPVDFSTRLLKRKLTVTLAYLSPIASDKQAYRSAQLWFTIDDGEKGLVPDRQNTEWQAVRKGTLQHEIFIGESPIVWNDNDLIIKVNCKQEAGKFREAIPYCLFVSFEVAEGFDVDLYTEVTTKIRQRVQIPNN